MKLNYLISQKWSSPSRVLCITGFLACFYYVLFVFWAPVELRWVRREVGSELVESEVVRDVGNGTLGVGYFLFFIALRYVV